MVTKKGIKVIERLLGVDRYAEEIENFKATTYPWTLNLVFVEWRPWVIIEGAERETLVPDR